ncbi:hypothetical protein ACRE_059340 [Hapsidospora chrysogenum ATCC 11550]|uniref:Uncharacterized protein n=1 Tax=Hapsidospora chrysogenum (strain ATCC 11550 / CBS 779.69 / DSM 880 / IAM 14645 / JCM 23072 / IMI 49137) TaxID=857340 RepID=A0A086T1T9_HAPC1|nr:hypothetical protein ACRE_059340 [Hapsidospora chrysogenum ATCC 11550]
MKPHHRGLLEAVDSSASPTIATTSIIISRIRWHGSYGEADNLTNMHVARNYGVLLARFSSPRMIQAQTPVSQSFIISRGH